MPEIIIGQVAGLTELTEEWVCRRQPQPGHHINDGDLGVVEDRFCDDDALSHMRGSNCRGRGKGERRGCQQRPGRNAAGDRWPIAVL